MDRRAFAGVDSKRFSKDCLQIGAHVRCASPPFARKKAKDGAPFGFAGERMGHPANLAWLFYWFTGLLNMYGSQGMLLSC
jgi:hypothetical protein